MSMVTASTERNRVYRRKFDHDLARELHAEGSAVLALARKFGVSETAVRRVVDDATRERIDANSRRYQRSGKCPDCGAQTTHRRDGDLRCKKCVGRLITKVDDGLAYCSRCKEWKPLDAFQPDPRAPVRGVRGECRACDTERRREYRQRNRAAEAAYDREYRARRRAAGLK